MSKDIAIVTAFFPIKSKQPTSFYLNFALPVISKCKKHIILFTCKEFADVFREMRKNLPFTLIIDEVDNDNLPKSLPIKDVLEKEVWNEIVSKSIIRKEWLKNTPGSFTVPLFQLWLSKAWFVSRALVVEKEFDLFMWNDIGNCRYNDHQENVEYWPSLKKLKMRGYKDDKIVFYQRRKHDVEKDLQPHVDDVISGSTILGTRKAWGPVCEDIAKMVKLNADRYIDGINDQTIYYYLSQYSPEKYKLYEIHQEDSRLLSSWFHTFTQDIDNVSGELKYEKDGTIISIKNFLFQNKAKSISENLKKIEKAWWDFALFPDEENKVYMISCSDTVSKSESFQRKKQFSLETFNKGSFSYMFKRSNKHFSTCLCAMCELKWLFESQEIKDELSRIIGETISCFNETFCSKYETGDFLSIHHDKRKGDYAFVFQLTEDWNPAYGGLLHFYDSETKNVYKTVNPLFNSLTIFKLKDVPVTDHFVSANVSSHARYAFTGWFSVTEQPSLTSTLLCEIMTRHKRDKGNGWHNFTLLYDTLLKDKKNDELRVFELGLGTNNTSIKSNMGPNGRPGASLYGWEEYFPNSRIYGADIDREILFNSGRIMTFYCDQTDPSCIAEMWSQPDLSLPFDLIVEDGLHTFEANKCFLENSIHKLKPEGLYIVEDISQISLFEKQIEVWKDVFPDFAFNLVKIPNQRNNFDNNLLLVNKKKVNDNRFKLQLQLHGRGQG